MFGELSTAAGTVLITTFTTTSGQWNWNQIEIKSKTRNECVCFSSEVVCSWLSFTPVLTPPIGFVCVDRTCFRQSVSQVVWNDKKCPLTWKMVCALSPCPSDGEIYTLPLFLNKLNHILAGAWNYLLSEIFLEVAPKLTPRVHTNGQLE